MTKHSTDCFGTLLSPQNGCMPLAFRIQPLIPCVLVSSFAHAKCIADCRPPVKLAQRDPQVRFFASSDFQTDVPIPEKQMNFKVHHICSWVLACAFVSRVSLCVRYSHVVHVCGDGVGLMCLDCLALLRSGHLSAPRMRQEFKDNGALNIVLLIPRPTTHSEVSWLYSESIEHLLDRATRTHVLCRNQ